MGRTSTMKFFGLGLVALSCAAVACAASDDGGGSGGGSGGLVSGSGGATEPGTGGTTTGTGGTTTGTGGTTMGTGGTTAAMVSCPEAGESLIDNGYINDGTLCGYAYTANWDGSEVTPACPTPCFEESGTELCATGQIPAQEGTMYPGIQIGFGVNQDPEGNSGQGYNTSQSTGVSVTVTASGNAGNLRLVAESPDGTNYCAETAASTGNVQVAWSDFRVNCWEAGGATLSGNVKQVAVQISEADEAQSVNLCVTDLSTY